LENLPEGLAEIGFHSWLAVPDERDDEIYGNQNDDDETMTIFRFIGIGLNGLTLQNS
jgi:hypothetical protein